MASTAPACSLAASPGLVAKLSGLFAPAIMWFIPMLCIPVACYNLNRVEVRFIDAAGGQTRVELEHRDFEPMGPDGVTMRTAVSAAGGWGTLMDLFAARIAAAATDQGVIVQ